jgi:hypothetical protein
MERSRGLHRSGYDVQRHRRPLARALRRRRHHTCGRHQLRRRDRADAMDSRAANHPGEQPSLLHQFRKSARGSAEAFDVWTGGRGLSRGLWPVRRRPPGYDRKLLQGPVHEARDAARHFDAFLEPYLFLNAQRLFIGGGLIGAIIVAYAGRGRTRRMAIGLLLTEAGFVGIGGPAIRPAVLVRARSLVLRRLSFLLSGCSSGGRIWFRQRG